jgi:hypothetical protein
MVLNLVRLGRTRLCRFLSHLCFHLFSMSKVLLAFDLTWALSMCIFFSMVRLPHRYLRIRLLKACLVCFISTVNSRSKKRSLL